MENKKTTCQNHPPLGSLAWPLILFIIAIALLNSCSSESTAEPPQDNFEAKLSFEEMYADTTFNMYVVRVIEEKANCKDVLGDPVDYSRLYLRPKYEPHLIPLHNYMGDNIYIAAQKLEQDGDFAERRMTTDKCAADMRIFDPSILDRLFDDWGGNIPTL